MIPRRVHNVHLTAPSDTLLRRGAVLLEDALHTASLPEADSGRLWLVRSLNLGKIHPHHSAAKLSLDIEEQFRHLRLSAVHGNDPAAAIARVVYFHDITEAYCCFALRLTQPEPINLLSEWFWRSVLPQWQPNWSRQTALKFTMFSILQTPANLIALVELVHRLQQANRLEVLLQGLEVQDGEALLQACGWTKMDLGNQSQLEKALLQQKISQLEPKSEYQSIEIEVLPIASLTLKPWLLRWGGQDARSQWLATIWLLIDQPYRRSDAQLSQRATIWMQKIMRSPQPEVIPSVMLPDLSTGEAILFDSFSQSHLGLTIENPAIEIESDTSVSDASETDVSASDQNIITDLNTTEISTASQSIHQVNLNSTTELIPSQLSHFYRSPYTGFFGVIPLLNQLGLTHRSDRLPLDFPAHLLAHLAATFGIPESDPIRQVLTSQDVDAPFRGVAPMTKVTPEVTAWIAAMRFWCRRYVGMPIAKLIGRSGSFTLTRTHLDIFFHHDQADIRIRRAGLDLDPGWVPWLGLVVLFHYGHGE